MYSSLIPIFYSPQYDSSPEPFDTFRKAAWLAASLREEPVEGTELRAPLALDRAALSSVHATEYVDAVRLGRPRELAESNGFGWSEGVWRAACASNGGAVAAALHAHRTRRHAGSLSSGLHHARSSHGAGFCTFNGLALAARAALETGARRVLVLDLDAHWAAGHRASCAAGQASCTWTSL